MSGSGNRVRSLAGHEARNPTKHHARRPYLHKCKDPALISDVLYQHVFQLPGDR